MSRRRARRKRHRLACKETERAWQALDEGREDRALAEGRRALAKAGESPDIWTDWGRILTAVGRLHEAERVLRTVTGFAPSYADGWAELADVLARKGLSIEAWRSIRRAVELRPSCPLFSELERRYSSALPSDFRGFEDAESPFEPIDHEPRTAGQDRDTGA